MSQMCLGLEPAEGIAAVHDTIAISEGWNSGLGTFSMLKIMDDRAYGSSR